MNHYETGGYMFLAVIAAVALIEMFLNQDELRAWEDKQFEKIKNRFSRVKRRLRKGLSSLICNIKKALDNARLRYLAAKIKVIKKIRFLLMGSLLRSENKRCDNSIELAHKKEM